MSKRLLRYLWILTGLVALVMSRLPELTGAQVRERIFETVRPVAALEGAVATGGVIADSTGRRWLVRASLRAVTARV